MGKKYFVFSDVHGHFFELANALRTAGFDLSNKEHIIVSCGDLFDRGHENKRCLEFVMQDVAKDQRILIKGNHEVLLEELIHRRSFVRYDHSNGTTSTVADLTMDTKFADEKVIIDGLKKNKLLMDYLAEVKDFYELDNAIFVHGWIPCTELNSAGKNLAIYLFDENWRDGNWAAARWINGMEAWRQKVRVPNKTIYCGHWHTSYGRSIIDGIGREFPNKYSTNPEHLEVDFSTWKKDGIVALDACTTLSKKVNVEVIEE